MASEADGINGMRAKALALVDAGVPPTILRPKRKRAFHRALKRGEQWALSEQSMRNIMNIIARLSLEEMLKPSPFLDLFKKI